MKSKPGTLAEFVTRAARYVRLLRSLAVELLWRFRANSILILATGMGGLMCQIAAIGVAVVYAQMLEQGRVVTLLGQQAEARSSVGLLAICGTGVLVTLLLSAYLTYVSGVQSIRLRRRYQVFCSVRALRLLASGVPVLPPPDKRQANLGHIMNLVRGDAAFHGRVAQMFIQAIVPAVTSILAVGALFYLEWLPTLVVLLATLVSTVFHYRASVAAAQGSRLMEQHAPQATRAYRERINALRGSTAVSDTKHKTVDEIFFQSGGVRASLDARDRRMWATESSKLVSNIFFAVIVFVVLLGLGMSIIFEGRGWERLIVYLLALRFGLVSLRSLTSTITSINRFYPQIRRYRDFVEMSATRSGVRPEPLDAYKVRAAADALGGSEESATLTAGSRVLLICPTELDRYTVGFILDSLIGASVGSVAAATSSLWLVTAWLACDPSLPIGTAVGLPAKMRRRDIEQLLEGTRLAEKVTAQLPDDFAKPMDPQAWARVDPMVRYALALVAAAHVDRQWVLLDEAKLRAVPANVREQLLRRLADRIVVIVSRSAAAVGQYSESMVIVADRRQVIGIGSPAWLECHRPEVEALLGEVLGVGESRATNGDEQEDAQLDYE